MLDDRFWSKVNKAGANGCWLWTAGSNGVGYGMFRPGGSASRKLAHRLSFEATFGPIPAGMLCLHKCDTPPCVNPEHLFLGTYRDNTADMLAKGRGLVGRRRPDVAGDNNWTRQRPEDVCRGERIGNAVLTEAKARSIIEARLAGETPTIIARHMGVSVGAVKNILQGRWWKHVHVHYADQLRATIPPPKRALTPPDVKNIRARLAAGETGRALSREYGVSFQTISEIKTGKIWRNL